MRRIFGLLAAGIAASGQVMASAGSADAFPDCPDIDVVFARGTAEPPGVGWIGQQFVDALRWRVGPRSMGVYAVNYPAVRDFPPTVDGIVDAGNHIRDIAAVCPHTQIVLGGFSRGAALVGYVLEPSGPAPALPPELVDDRVTAVVQLGKPSAVFLESIGAPPLRVDPRYAAKTIDLCAPGDPVCSAGGDDGAHSAYAANGMTVQAADFAADRLRPPEIVPDQAI